MMAGRRTGARPTNDISIEYEIRSKFVVLWVKMCSTDQNEILHTSRVQNFVMISRICYEQEHYKISLNFEFDRKLVNGTGARWHH